MPPGTRRFNPRTGKIERVGRGQQVPTNLDVGTTRKLGRSGTIRVATREQIRSFQQQQAETRTPQKIPKLVQEQAALAGKALGDPDLPKRISLQQQAPTVRTGKSGTLQQTQPDPELFVGDAPVRAEVEKAFKGVPGADEFIPGDIGTEIILSEVRRRRTDLSAEQMLGATQQLATEAGLKGFKAKRSTFGNIVGSKTLGIPNVLLAVVTAGLGAQAAAGQGATTTTGAGQAAQFGGQTFPGGTQVSASGLSGAGQAASFGGQTFAGGTQVGPTASGLAVGAASRGGLESAKVGSKAGGLSASSIAKNVLRGVNIVDQILGSRGGGTGTTGTATVGQPQLILQAPQVVQQRQTTTAGALPAFARRNRDRFGGTRTASLFKTRGEQQRRRNSLLGGR